MHKKKSAREFSIKTVNLENGLPPVRQALIRLDRELAIAAQERSKFVKFVHGYGSSGVGGDIRIAVQKSLRESVDSGRIRRAFMVKIGRFPMNRRGACLRLIRN